MVKPSDKGLKSSKRSNYNHITVFDSNQIKIYQKTALLVNSYKKDQDIKNPSASLPFNTGYFTSLKLTVLVFQKYFLTLLGKSFSQKFGFTVFFLFLVRKL